MLGDMKLEDDLLFDGFDNTKTTVTLTRSVFSWCGRVKVSVELKREGSRLRQTTGLDPPEKFICVQEVSQQVTFGVKIKEGLCWFPWDWKGGYQEEKFQNIF